MTISAGQPPEIQADQPVIDEPVIAEPVIDEPVIDEPVIIAATMTAGHDGAAEAVIDIRYPNGAVRSVNFDCDSLGLALDRHHIASLEDLTGRPWTVLVETPSVHQNQP